MPKSISLSSFDLTSFRHLLHDRAVAIYLELVRNIQDYIQPLIGKHSEFDGSDEILFHLY